MSKLPVPTLPPYPQTPQLPANKVPATRRAPAITRANSTASGRRGGALLQLAIKAAGKSQPLKNDQPRSNAKGGVKVPVAPVGSLHSGASPRKSEQGQGTVFVPKLLGSISVGSFKPQKAATHKVVQ